MAELWTLIGCFYRLGCPLIAEWLLIHGRLLVHGLQRHAQNMHSDEKSF
jgi:hypothetical protein